MNAACVLRLCPGSHLLALSPGSAEPAVLGLSDERSGYPGGCDVQAYQAPQQDM